MKLIPRIESIMIKRREEGFTIEGEKVSQTSLARELGVRKQQVSLWSRGGALPRPDTLFHMASILNVRPDELYEFIPPTEEERLENIRNFEEKEKEDLLRRKQKKTEELEKLGLTEEQIHFQLRQLGLLKYDEERV
ncbi:helix-turn-helix transcriptional regulator [Hazenella sp. IB182357]|uniref:Helix-turn-helix transcriptional regulator n=1 Tax=Polycladospora coralii TaxID=2771432 RepID=A0A926N4P9_9BACL|nr:helix-turn-helix transcriptional regulator [Polycladospora coralii]MBD1370744.1 helix-turn-helix transcriptional regulator [Polycladospora coralii]MBS7529682.1 helix-turn-helix transcriptional regulator [Polycladospora coralii]